MTATQPERSPLFHGLDPVFARSLGAAGRAHKLVQGSTLFQSADTADYLWLVCDGLLVMSASSGAGRQIAMHLIVPGEAAGFAGLAGPGSYGLRAYALCATTVVGLPIRTVLESSRRHPQLALNLLRMAATRLMHSERMRSIQALPGSARLVLVLEALFETLGSEIPLTRRIIGELAGVVGETSIRLLSPLGKKGIISTKRGRLHVSDPLALADLARRAEAKA